LGKYGHAAETAARSLAAGGGDPRTAWEVAVTKIFPNSRTSAEKGCPRVSFLALCGLGFVKGVPPGSYTRSVKTKAYVTRAVTELRSNPAMANDEQGLWRTITEGREIAPNHQMDVVATLWRKALIR